MEGMLVKCWEMNYWWNAGLSARTRKAKATHDGLEYGYPGLDLMGVILVGSIFRDGRE